MTSARRRIAKLRKCDPAIFELALETFENPLGAGQWLSERVNRPTRGLRLVNFYCHANIRGSPYSFPTRPDFCLQCSRYDRRAGFVAPKTIVGPVPRTRDRLADDRADQRPGVGSFSGIDRFVRQQAAPEKSALDGIANPSSKDSMLLMTLPPGGYTAQASGVGGVGGVAIVEVYEVP